MAWREITGEEPPPTPVSAATYAEHGLPWFSLYDEGRGDLTPSEKLKGVRSVREIDVAKGFTSQQDPIGRGARRPGRRTGMPRGCGHRRPVVAPPDDPILGRVTAMRGQTKRGMGRWRRIEQSLPRHMETLLASEVYGRGPGRQAPPRAHGVYLFSRGRAPLYVGRTGLTERSARVGKPGSSNFRARLAGHTRPGSPHNSAPFAWRLALEAAEKEEWFATLPPGRRERAAHAKLDALFCTAKEKVTAMDFRVVAIPDDHEAYAFELYAAVTLETPYNSFATS